MKYLVSLSKMLYLYINIIKEIHWQKNDIKIRWTFKQISYHCHMNNLNNPYVAFFVFAHDWIDWKGTDAWDWISQAPLSTGFWLAVRAWGQTGETGKRESQDISPFLSWLRCPLKPSNISSMVHILPGRPTWSDSPVLEMLPFLCLLAQRVGFPAELAKVSGATPCPQCPTPRWTSQLCHPGVASVPHHFDKPSSFSVLIRLQPPQLEMEHHLAKLPTSSFAHSLSLAFPSWSYLNFLPQRGLKLNGPVG